MAVLVSNDARLNTNYTFNSASGRNIGITFGDMNCSGVTYAGGGVTMTLPFVNLVYIAITPRIVTATALFFEYVESTGKVRIRESLATTTAAGIPFSEIASDTALSSLTTVPFVAIGYD